VRVSSSSLNASKKDNGAGAGTDPVLEALSEHIENLSNGTYYDLDGLSFECLRRLREALDLDLRESL